MPIRLTKILAAARTGTDRNTPATPPISSPASKPKSTKRGHRHSLAHQIRAQHIVLEHPVDPDEANDGQHVVVAAQSGDADADHGGGQRTEDGDEASTRFPCNK